MPSELQWLAFRYIFGEMTADEAAEFEVRLDHDQTAREAVAESVALAGAIRRGEQPSSVILVRRGRTRNWLVAGAVAAGVALAGGWFLLGSRKDLSSEARHSTTPFDGAVALTWSGLRHADEDDPS